MKKILLSSAVLATMSVLQALAVPAPSTPKEYEMPDGTVHTLTCIGDEHFRYYVAEDGSLLTRGSDGYFYALGTDSEGNLTDTRIRAFTKDAELYLSNTDAESITAAIKKEETRIMRKVNAHSTQTRASSMFPSTGDHRGLLLLVEFEDKSFKPENNREAFERMANEVGYSDYDGTGSVRDWFLANSSGRFNPTWDVYGPVRLDHPESFYGRNIGGWSSDINPEQMAIDACNKLDDQIDFSKYDNDGDGIIDNVFIIYAGYGENSRYGTPDGIWPHSWDVYTEGTTLKYDGVILNHYACSNELNDGQYRAGIGTFCHEFSHVLGLPDLYDRDQSFYTCGNWDPMCTGMHNNLGRSPAFMSGPERYYLGWVDPYELTGPENITLDYIGTGDICYFKTETEGEYYFFENRQQVGWDIDIPGHGLIVWHYVEWPRAQNTGFVNSDKDHQLLDLVEADGHPYESSAANDAFPGKDGNRTELTDDTKPNMRSWAGNPQNKPITDIREEMGMIYFRVCGGVDAVPAPVATEATEITADGFTANWTEDYRDCSFTISVYTLDAAGNPEYVPGYEKKSAGFNYKLAVTGLEPETEYYYTVTARDSGFGLTSPVSNSMAVKTLKENEDNAVDSVFDEDNNAPVEYFDLQGRRLSNPQQGQLVIKRQGSKVSKIVI